MSLQSAQSNADVCLHRCCFRGTVASSLRSAAAVSRRAALLDKLSQAASGAKDWDGSTKAGDDDIGKMDMSLKVREADDFLRENPDMRGMHSVQSVRSLLSRGQQQQ